MPTFSYIARNAQGNIIKGQTEAPNQNMVARVLRDQGLMPTLIEAGGSISARSARAAIGKGGRVKLEDQVILTRQFSVMIRAGLPMIEVLNILAEQSEKRELKAVMKQVERDVGGGASLYEALSKHKKVFSTFYLSMVMAGEAAGMLDSILDQVASYLEKVASIQRKIKSAIMYPSVVSVVACLITVFLMVQVVPVFAEIFAEMEGNLPMPTQIVIGISEFLQNHMLLAAVMVGGTVLGIWQISRTEKGRRMLDRFKLRMPIFGPLFLKVAVARFTRTLGTLIRSGVNILTALEICAKTAGNMVVEDAIVRTRVAIQTGESIATPLRESNVFPPMVVRMIDVGERTGALEGMLTKIAEFYEDQVDSAVAGLTSMIEPILMVFLGLVIGSIVIAMFMPMFKMIEMVG